MKLQPEIPEILPKKSAPGGEGGDSGFPSLGPAGSLLAGAGRS